MARIHFIDVYTGPESLGDYAWEIGHDEEQPSGGTVALDRTAPTSGVGFVRQAGDPSPLIRQLRGQILTRAQYQKMWAYWFICAGLGPGPRRSIHFVDQLGSRFEVLFTTFMPQIQRVARNPRGTNDDEKLVKWQYDATLEVLNAISGWP